MNLLAFVGSPRKGQATDTLIDKAIEGFLSKAPGASATKILLVEQNIQFCKNCLACRESKKPGPRAKCSIHDDMDEIGEQLIVADRLLFGTPVHMGYATAILMNFLERVCWTFAKPEGRVLTITHCPIPRDTKKRKAGIIVTSGIIPPIYRRFCDEATALIKDVARCSLNAETVADFYAGDIEGRGVERYFAKAFDLGSRLGS